MHELMKHTCESSFLVLFQISYDVDTAIYVLLWQHCNDMLICNQVTIFSNYTCQTKVTRFHTCYGSKTKVLFPKQKLCFRNKNFVFETKTLFSLRYFT